MAMNYESYLIDGNVSHDAIGILLENEVSMEIFEKLITDARLLAMGIAMKDVLKIMLVRDNIFKTGNDVLAEIEVNPVLEFPQLGLPQVDAHAPDDLFSNLEKFKTVLSNHPMCTSLQEKIWSGGVLEDFDHTVFVRASVAMLLESIGQRYPTTDEKIALAAIMADCKFLQLDEFADTKARYFSKGSKDNGNHTGFIADRLRTIRRATPNAPKKRAREEVHVVSSGQEASIKKLKLAMPTEQNKNHIIELLKETFTVRQKRIPNEPIRVMLVEYGRLLDFNGEMILEEFRMLGIGEANGLRDYFPTVVMAVTDEINDESFMTAVKKVYQSNAMKNVKKIVGSPEEIFTRANVYPPSLLQVLTANEDADAIADANKYGVTQPYLLQIGETFFAVIEKTPINCGVDPVKAFDVLFKLYFVFKLQYPPRLLAFYSFFERYIYRIVSNRKPYVSASKFYNKIFKPQT